MRPWSRLMAVCSSYTTWCFIRRICLDSAPLPSNNIFPEPSLVGSNVRRPSRVQNVLYASSQSMITWFGLRFRGSRVMTSSYDWLQLGKVVCMLVTFSTRHGLCKSISTQCSPGIGSPFMFKAACHRSVSQLAIDSLVMTEGGPNWPCTLAVTGRPFESKSSFLYDLTLVFVALMVLLICCWCEEVSNGTGRTASVIGTGTTPADVDAVMATSGNGAALPRNDVAGLLLSTVPVTFKLRWNMFTMVTYESAMIATRVNNNRNRLFDEPLVLLFSALLLLLPDEDDPAG